MIEESARWLLINNRVKEAKHVLKKAARWNGVNFEKIEHILREIGVPSKGESQATETKLSTISYDQTGNSKANGGVKETSNGEDVVEKYTVLDILKNRSLRVNTLILWWAWIVSLGTYYGLTLVASQYAGNRFVNFFLSGLIEVPGILIEMYLFNKIGRKKTLILWFFLAGTSLLISTILLTVLKDNNVAEGFATAFALIGKMAATGTISTLFLYTPEIYPTNYRNSGLGIASAISRLGGVVAPFISNLADTGLWIPGAIYCGLCLMVTLMILRLPESVQHQLPGTLADCDAWENETEDNTAAPESKYHTRL